jgi:glutathione S-transferase
MLKIYHVPGTRSVRPLWLAYELGLDVEIIEVDFSPAYRNTSEWRAISPAGKVPALSDGDVSMFESGAMVEFILDRYGNGRLRPKPGTAESALYLQWTWFAEATLSRPMGFVRMMKMAKSGAGDIGDIAAEGEKKARAGLQAVEQGLADRDFLLAEGFTAADIMMGYSLELLANLGVFDKEYPNAHAYLERLKSRDACRRAMSA